ncbi:hypothetical protein LX32DRAFT_668093 [Colletotrichum zoysiae]|uniref:Modin n=1 Tax=Colletotrichum zoysiae TaxID=1216348 RepID=A0AAD9H5U6_9PEZI|nr:hypothetical protein LX32DRAFT_668093 [Colletotrichum zoysiae]
MAENDNEQLVAIAALVIAIAALIAAELQILQAIFASARGLPNCNEVVMGGWSKGTKIRPKFTQLRLELKFEAPIIFLTPPKNTKKPGTGEMWSAASTKESCNKNRLDYAKLFQGSGSKDRERDSPVEPTLAVMIQAKERSFDTVPAMKKPFATTTIPHLIELAAILGVYWKVFNRDNSQYRAEGNGYSLTGSRIPDLGIQLVFQKTGHTAFEARRVIPTSEVKELCFGRVSTLSRKKNNPDEDIEWQNPLMTSSGTGARLDILQLGSTKEIAETLTQVGCNGTTAFYYTEEKKHRHLSPASSVFA